MRRVSKKRAKIERDMRAERRAYLLEFPQCVVCWMGSQCVHETACGSHRGQAIQEPSTWLATCNDCNCHQLTDYAKWPLVRQLAMKWCYDRARFDLLAFNMIRGRGPLAITMAEVIPWICRELDGGQ